MARLYVNDDFYRDIAIPDDQAAYCARIRTCGFVSYAVWFHRTAEDRFDSIDKDVCVLVGGEQHYLMFGPRLAQKYLARAH